MSAPVTIPKRKSNEDDIVANSPRKAQKDSDSPSKRSLPEYISLTTHPGITGSKPAPINWGANTPEERGPIIASNLSGGARNALGAHGGSYCIYKALAVAMGTLDPTYRPNYDLTEPPVKIGPFPSWTDPSKIVSIDPWGAEAVQVFRDQVENGVDIRPTIAITRAHCDLAEMKDAIRAGRLKPDGKVLMENGQMFTVKAAVEPVWWLPGIASRLGVSEDLLRHHMFLHTNGMYPELITRKDIRAFLPPIGGLTIYIFGDPATIPDPDVPLTVRVHDECNGSDVFGSDICTCRPYLIHGIEECVRTAQSGGAGVIVYFRKEGRALGEVTKYLVYNRRKRQEGGDTAAQYFNCTAHVAGVEDMRFQALMPDALHWLGITRIHRLISMSNLKYDAISASGIEVLERVPIPPEMVPEDAKVEIDAKVYAGYHGGETHQVSEQELKQAKGRKYDGE